MTPTPSTTIAGRALARILILALATLLAACGTSSAKTGEAERIAEALALSPGQAVADVGAGDGDWSIALAQVVGDEGRVYATEVEEDEVEDLRRRFEKKDFHQIEVLLGDQEETGLPAGCCDAILLRLVYHHFTDPGPMRASLRRALRPGGRLAIIDIEPQKGWRRLEGVPDRGGHGIPMPSLIDEMTGDGFTVLERHEVWNDDEDRYCVVFQAEPPAPSAADSTR